MQVKVLFLKVWTKIIKIDHKPLESEIEEKSISRNSDIYSTSYLRWSWSLAVLINQQSNNKGQQVCIIFIFYKIMEFSVLRMLYILYIGFVFTAFWNISWLFVPCLQSTSFFMLSYTTLFCA